MIAQGNGKISLAETSEDPMVREVLVGLGQHDPDFNVEGTKPDSIEVFEVILPQEALDYVREITRARAIARLVLEGTHRYVCRRLPTTLEPLAASRKRWESAWEANPRALKKRMVKLRNEALKVAHGASMAVPSKLSKLPKRYLSTDIDSLGRISVRDPEFVGADLGQPAYLEHTPGEVARFSHDVWRATRQLVNNKRRPYVWDITAGSGTVADYFALLGEGRCVSSDAVAIRDGITCAPVSKAGLILEHTKEASLNVPGLRISTPDLVFIDPPSRGSPNHATLYDGHGLYADLATLTSEDWVYEVGKVARRVAARLAPGGLVSLLVRAGSRRGSEVVEQREVLGALMVLLEHELEGLPKVAIHSTHDLVFESARLNQVSLGKSRVPSTLLLLRRSQ